jgi:hypothetical protein
MQQKEYLRAALFRMQNRLYSAAWEKWQAVFQEWLFIQKAQEFRKNIEMWRERSSDLTAMQSDFVRSLRKYSALARMAGDKVEKASQKVNKGPPKGQRPGKASGPHGEVHHRKSSHASLEQKATHSQGWAHHHDEADANIYTIVNGKKHYTRAMGIDALETGHSRPPAAGKGPKRAYFTWAGSQLQLQVSRDD